jgi:hypothetical protein
MAMLACFMRSVAPLLIMSCGAVGAASAAPLADCKSEEAALVKDESELPRLEVASPADRPTTCITLETIIAFASRIKAHVAHCPTSSYTPSAASWEITRTDYAKRFIENRCKRTF